MRLETLETATMFPSTAHANDEIERSNVSGWLPSRVTLTVIPHPKKLGVVIMVMDGDKVVGYL
jgi:hypothetical protein